MLFLHDSDLLLFIDDVICWKKKQNKNQPQQKIEHSVFIDSLLVDT